MFYDFQTTTYGKWILVGEHSVVRGHEALVFPIKEKQLSLKYTASSPSISAEYSYSNGADVQLLFWSVLEQGVKLLGLSLNQLGGHFQLDCNIPIGVGMGASAALCVAMSRWFSAQGMLEASKINEFAKELEHLFHGKSSGLDIAGVSSEQGIFFKAGEATPINSVIQPKWYLSSCHQIGITSHCVKQVQSLWESNPKLAQALDEQMVQSVVDTKAALEQGGEQAVSVIAEAMNKAADCFFKWGLVSEGLQQHMNRLNDAGALAVKPTGSGGGGYVVSLWEKQPPFLDFEMIAV